MTDNKYPALVYAWEPTAGLFHADNSLVRCLMGPFGSGKSAACTMEIIMRAVKQRAHAGVRHSRWAIIRNSYPELTSTTIKTWQEWIPEEYGAVVYKKPIECIVNFPLNDGTRVRLEVYFIALDKPKDVGKLLSMDLTGAWINEAREVPVQVLNALTGRIGRYPPKKKGGCSWRGVIMDTNPPDDDHYIYDLFEVEQPDGYEIFHQPPALIKSSSGEWIPNPSAENIRNLELGYDYYYQMLSGKTDDWIKVYIEGGYGSIQEGRLVYPEYSDAIHCAKEPLEPYGGIKLIIGMDFGLTPAAVICQKPPRGGMRVLDEVCATNLGLRNFLREGLKPMLANKYPGFPVDVHGDPAGSARADTDERTCYDILREEGFNAKPAISNSFTARREAVSRLLTEMVEGIPSFQMSPTARTLRKGFVSKYIFERVQVTGEERYKNQPVKNMVSHPHDGMQYAAMSGIPSEMPTPQMRFTAAPVRNSGHAHVI